MLSKLWATCEIWVKFLSRNSKVFEINTNYLSCLVDNQAYNLFVCTLCPCLTSLLGCLCGPVINSVFGRRCRKVVSRGREDTRVWYRETMFSQMVSYDFLLHEPLHGYFLYLVSAPPEKPTRRCKPEEGYLRCSKRFDHRSHSIILLLFEFR